MSRATRSCWTRSPASPLRQGDRISAATSRARSTPSSGRPARRSTGPTGRSSTRTRRRCGPTRTPPRPSPRAPRWTPRQPSTSPCVSWTTAPRELAPTDGRRLSADAVHGNTFDQNKGNTSSPAALCDFSVPAPTCRDLPVRLHHLTAGSDMGYRRVHGTDQGHRSGTSTSTSAATRPCAPIYPAGHPRRHRGRHRAARRRSRSGPRPSTSRSTA